MDQVPERPESHALLAPGEVAQLFCVTPKTIGRWHTAGILPAVRTAGGHRRFPAGYVYELYDFLLEVGADREGPARFGT